MTPPDPNTGPRVSLLEAIQRALHELLPDTMHAPRAELIRRELVMAEERVARARTYVLQNIRDAEKRHQEDRQHMSREAQLAVLLENGITPIPYGRILNNPAEELREVAHG